MPSHLIPLVALACTCSPAPDGETASAPDSSSDTATETADTGDTAPPHTGLIGDTDTGAAVPEPGPWTWAATMTSEEDDWTGRALAGLGDRDGDGHEDLAVGAPNAEAGAVWVFSGLSEPSQVSGESPYDLAGYAVAGAGSWLVVGAPGQDAEAESGGAAYFTAGGDLAGAAGKLTGREQGSSVGAVLAPIGARMAVSASGEGVGGRAYVVPAGSGRFSIGDVAQLVVEADQAGMQLSVGLAAGDLDGDGLDELVVGAPAEGDHETGSGFVVVVSGEASGTVLSSDADLVFTGDPEVHLGRSVATGDLDGDGSPELASGAYWGGEKRAGEVWVWSGQPEASDEPVAVLTGDGDYAYGGIAVAVFDGGLAVGEYGLDEVGAVRWFEGPLSGSVRLEDADETLWGETKGGAFGYTLAGVGDFTGGGFEDLAVGAYVAGEAHLFSRDP